MCRIPVACVHEAGEDAACDLRSDNFLNSIPTAKYLFAFITKATSWLWTLSVFCRHWTCSFFAVWKKIHISEKFECSTSGMRVTYDSNISVMETARTLKVYLLINLPPC